MNATRQLAQGIALAALLTLAYTASAFYDPTIGKWISRDPIGEQGGANLYGFVGNDSINHVDPLGLAIGDWYDWRTWILPDLWARRQRDDFAISKGYKYGYEDAMASFASKRDANEVNSFYQARAEEFADFKPIAEQGANFVLQVATSVTPTAVGTKCTSALAEKLLSARRIRSGLKADAGHRAASFLTKEQLETGTSFLFKGGDGVERTLLQAEGVLNEEAGIFEYILNPSGEVTHQRFIPGGKITGAPNQKIP